MKNLEFCALPTFLLALLLCVPGAGSSADRKNPGRGLQFKTLLHDSKSFQRHDPWTFVIRDKHEEEGFLAVGKCKVVLPPVDYSKQMVICLLGGWRQSCDMTITIDSVVQAKDGVLVYSHEREPGALSMVAGYPAHIVVLEKVMSGVDFTPTIVVRE